MDERKIQQAWIDALKREPEASGSFGYRVPPIRSTDKPPSVKQQYPTGYPYEIASSFYDIIIHAIQLAEMYWNVKPKRAQRIRTWAYRRGTLDTAE